MSKNGIAWLSTKEARQTQKLIIAQAKRQGKTVADDGTISGSIDSSKQYYRTRNNYDITQLPTQYTGNDIFNNPNVGGLVVGRPWISGPSYTAGLYRTTFTNYNVNTVNLTVFSTPANRGASSVVTSLDCATSTTHLGYEFIGYILPDYTGTWTFSTGGLNVDDAYSVWIGANAITGYTTGNATFSVSLTQGSGTVSLTSGTYYPIRIQFGNNAGPGGANLYYAHTGQGATSNWTGKIFYNSATNGF